MHCLTDFKNFARAELDLFKPLSVLLGRNGSGKTNLIEGVELFATLARGVRSMKSPMSIAAERSRCEAACAHAFVSARKSRPAVQ